MTLVEYAYQHACKIKEAGGQVSEAILLVFDLVSRCQILEKENRDLRASLEHLEKLASARIDNERKTSKIPPPEHVDD